MGRGRHAMSTARSSSTSATSMLPATSLSSRHADLLCRLAIGGDLELLRRLVLALGNARDLGHVCLDLHSWVGEPLELDEAKRPSLADARAQLLATGVVANAPSDPAEVAEQALSQPLVLDSEHRLYTLRHYRNEQRIAKFVQERLQRKASTTAEQLKATLAAVDLLPAPGTSEPDWQLAAVVAAASQSL